MHKLILGLLFILLISFTGENERDFVGKYGEAFGGTLELKSDSTFFYEWKFDLSYGWSQGTWRVKEDSIWLHIIPVYDTLTVNRINGVPHSDSLFLSLDNTAERYDQKPNYHGQWQGIHPPPSKLIYLDQRLYLPTYDGKPDKQEQKSFFSNRYYPTYFQRLRAGGE